jgi:multidrug efflux pump subunit AcrA (membrane-fusion protein)
MPPLTVVVAPVTQAELEPSLYLVGTAYPLISSTISAEVAGKIEHFTVDEGTFVEEGEVICQLDKMLKLIEVKRAKAQLERARAELSKLEAGSREEEISQAQALVDNRKAVLEKLRLNKERMEDLFSKGMVTLEQQQNAHWDYEQGLAQLNEAEAVLKLAVEGARSEDVMMAKAVLATQQAELERAQDQLDKVSITVPFSGVITKKHKELGEWVNQGEAVADIINIEKILVYTSIPEKDVQGVKRGQRAEIFFDAYPDRLFTGSIKEIIPQADTKSHTFPVKVELDNKEHKLYAGMFARIKLIMGKQRQVLLAPKDAMLKSDSGRYLFVVRDSIAHRVEVKTGQEKGDAIEVQGELKPGDKVVVTNNEVLRDKMKVMVAPGK